MEQLKILAVIPARKGSKLLPFKNSKSIHGKPLISWTIDAALNSKYISQVCVSSDCERIQEIAIKQGIDVPRLRPKNLSQDDTPSNKVILYEIEHYPEADVICMLQPTSPLRTHEHIDQCIQKFIKEEAQVMVSVSKDKHSPYWSFNLNQGFLKSLFPFEKIKLRRQELDETYSLNGAIYLAKTSYFKETKSFLTPVTKAYIMSHEVSIDIDDLSDFKEAERLLKAK